jgi:ribosomal protein S18 acetylase RimI-like enzyme
MAEYQSLLDRIQTIVTSMGYHIEMTLTGATYVFTIYDNETRACYIQIGQSTGTIVIGKTRTKKEIEDHDTIDIAWLSTEPAYKGQGLALLLLIYSICYLKQQLPDIDYVTLDDDSDRSDKMEKNIYDSLGFAFRDNVQIDVSSTKKLNLSGPEKQLLLDGEFIRRANLQLNTKFPGMGGKRKTRKPRKSRKSRKSRKTKQSRKARKTKRRL